MVRAVDLYRGAPRATRVHTRLRWWWCPFAAIEAEVPTAGDVLEVGCGHGLLSVHLGLQSTSRRVTGVDIDETKIAEARAAASRLPAGAADVTFEAVAPGYVPHGAWDAVVIADVLYLLPETDQQRLLVAAAETLRPGGRVVVKEMGATPTWKATWNRWQELLATRVFRVTESVGSGLSFVSPDAMAMWLTTAGLTVSHRRIDHGYPWPHHLLVGQAPLRDSDDNASRSASISSPSL